MVQRYARFGSELAPGTLAANLFGDPLVEVAGGESAVVDARGVERLTPYFAAGTHQFQPCDADGNTLPGTSSATFSSGTEITTKSPYYLVTADAGNALTVARN